MTGWKTDLLSAKSLPATVGESWTSAIHLAIFAEPFLSLLLAGEKTIESRFSRTHRAPYRRVSVGDLVLVKGSGGPVVAAFRVEEVWFYRVRPNILDQLKGAHGTGMCVDDDFWASRRESHFATFMRVGPLIRTPIDIPCLKQDRQGWVVLRERPRQLDFGFDA